MSNSSDSNKIIISNNIRSNVETPRLRSTPRVRQVYWVEFPNENVPPEFKGEHPGLVVRAAKHLRDACVVLPITSAKQKIGTHFHQLSKNPNPKGEMDGLISYVVCDHMYTVHMIRMRPLLTIQGNPTFPKVGQEDFNEICQKVKKAFHNLF